VRRDLPVPLDADERRPLRDPRDWAIAALEGCAAVDASCIATSESRCRQGDSGSCEWVAAVYLLGTGSERSREKGAKALEHGCLLGSATACSALADVMEQRKGEAKPVVKTTKLYQMGCARGDGYACFRLGRRWERGDGVAIDLTLALAMFRRGCDLGEPASCVGAARICLDRNDRWAAELFKQRACDAGSGMTCRILAEALSKDGLNEQAAARYAMGCNRDDFRSCAQLALQTCEGVGVRRDAERCRELLQKACDGGDERGCEGLRQRR